MQDYDYFPLSFCLPADRDKLLEFDSSFRAASRKAVRAGAAGGVQPGGACSGGAVGHPAANPGGLPLLEPPAGCWPVPGVQPQPMSVAGDRMVYIVKPDGGSRGQGIYLALTLDDIEELKAAEEEAADAAAASKKGMRMPGRRPGSAGAAAGSGDDDDGDGDDEEEAQKFVMVQAYLPRPLLMDGRKFDLRIYVLVTSVYPTLRLFIYRQGLVRFATEQYEAPNEGNVAKRRMFLTNYAVNKPGERPRSPKTGVDDVPDGAAARSASSSSSGVKAPRFDSNPAGGADDVGDDTESDTETPSAGGAASSAAAAAGAPGGGRKPPIPPRPECVDIVRARLGCKWTMSTLLECLESQGVDTAALWERIKDVITKTILAVRPAMAQKYKAARPTLKKENPPPADPKPKRRIPRPAYVKPAAAPGAAAASEDGGDEVNNPSGTGAGAGAAAAAATNLVPLSTTTLVPPPSFLGGLEESLRAYGAGPAGLPAGPAATSIRGGGVATAAAAAAAPKAGMRGSMARTGSSAGMGGGGGAGSVDDPLGIGLGLVGTSVSLLSSRPPVPTKPGLAGKGGGGGGGGLGRTASKAALVGGGGLGAGADGAFDGLSGGGIGLSVRPLAAGAAAAPAGRSLSASRSSSRGRLSLSTSSDGGLDTVSVATSVTARTLASDVAPPPLLPKAPAADDAGSVAPPASAPAAAPSTGGSGSGSSSAPASATSTPKRPPMLAGGSSSSSSSSSGGAAFDEEDGEQGFRAYELMGLDVILDMSHCICAKTAEHQRLYQEPKRWSQVNSLGARRCQPRPVLLEINQSCSLHSDSDLDRIVKGDAVKDAFIMSAPDDKWLLDQFADAIRAEGGLAAFADGAGGGAGAGAGGFDTVSAAVSDPADAAAAVPAAAPSVSPPTPAPELLAAVEAAEAVLADPSLDARKTLVTRTGTVVDDRTCLNDIEPIVRQAVRLSRASITESATLLHAYRRGFPAAISGAGKGSAAAGAAATAAAAAAASAAAKAAGEAGVGAETPDENRPPSSGAAPIAAAAVAAAAVTTTAPSPASTTTTTTTVPPPPLPLDVVPWVPAPIGSLYAAFPEVWKEEFWFGHSWAEKELRGAGGASSSSSSSSFGGVVNTVLALKRAATMTKAEMADKERALKEKEKSVIPAGWSLGTVPQLSQRAQLVLLLRRIYEEVHAGGFERMMPPPSTHLADRYRRIAEYVPPSMRETFAFSKRRLEALALRAELEAKKNSGFRM